MKHTVYLIFAGTIIVALLSIICNSLGAGDEWTRKADMPTARYRLRTEAVNGKIYAIGGDHQGVTFSVEEYDPATDRWTVKACMPTTNYCFATSVVNGKIYAIGGSNGIEIFSTVFEYDPATDKWTRKADMPTPRRYLSTSVVNGKIYAIGGMNTNGFLSVIEEYDVVADKWVKKANMPKVRYDHSAEAVNGKIYIIGGSDGAGILSTVEEYDPMTGAWKKKADMPSARSTFSTSAVNGRIYVIGGSIMIGQRPVSLSTVEEYDPAQDKWTKKSDMPTARGKLSTSVVNGKIYAVGGLVWAGLDPNAMSEIALPTVEEYIPDGWPFAVSSQGKLVGTWAAIKANGN